MPRRDDRSTRRRWAVLFAVGVVAVVTLVVIILVVLVQQGSWISG